MTDKDGMMQNEEMAERDVRVVSRRPNGNSLKSNLKLTETGVDSFHNGNLKT